MFGVSKVVVVLIDGDPSFVLLGYNPSDGLRETSLEKLQ
jgi:hypothetical protein